MDIDRDGEITIISLPFIETSVRFASMRQIHAAIGHFDRGDFECAATLAAAACGMLPAIDNAALPASKASSARVETIGHWLAQGTILDRTGNSRRRESIVIRTAEVAIAIHVAITRFDIAFPDQKTPQMIGFRRVYQFCKTLEDS
ncbi:hypothetical protein [Bradyrhizobium sp. B024]|uniref:Uncharacterized protein n=1 Tax=Bradyrhizobium diazoefficiens TaxID=1355477 RepID=A0A810BKA9_9BRAD|nr:hypothetical protein [Bradyrhizobium japonicum]BCE33576.1 hypothetical protein XF2B_73450 [Bradyrhizobium diazoefficiens]BCE77192.1 hypothetical protein XF8B_73030 [Bradyrhizobium diazoefficiens]BCF20652.1 hypothetical protein XF13B_73430 [Bradyrhizobium diazoefficiens]